MKINDLPDELGRPRAFEVGRTHISRSTVIRILRSIPGVVVKHSAPWYRLGLRIKFCEFELGGSRFEASDAGDDTEDRILIGPSTVGSPQQIELLKSAFLRHSPPRWIVPIRIASISLLCSGAMHFLLAKVMGPGLDFMAFVSAGVFLVGALLLAYNIRS